ncbi:MAG TPA: winged helix-turn-helix domain-containing protein [Polyangiaceae bacterium]|nr:winged helix-turn-helix domain-containing protein [Polyangiaceae bacterium]
MLGGREMAGHGMVYVFHSFRVDPGRRSLLEGERSIAVTAKVFDLLLFLIRSRERVVLREELMAELWPDTTVEDGNISVAISLLRKALSSGAPGQTCIETLPRVGYRFVAEVREEALEYGAPPLAPVAPRAAPSPSLALLAELPAKLLCPEARDAIPRERLFRALDERAGRPVTWLHAAAGSGKTTLLSSYLRARPAPVLWYDVDPGDSDVSSMFHYLRLGAQALLGGAAASATSVTLDLPVPRPGPPEAERVFARRFFEALFGQLPPGTCLAFDNYQDAAQAPAFNNLFRELCSTLTPRVRLLVASRGAPPPLLARFGASGEMQLLSNRDLRFDPEEVQHLLRRNGSSARNPERDGARLLAQTDGWAVAVALLAKGSTSLQLAPSVLRQPEDELQGIFDFVAGEVFETLDAPSRELLLQFALLPSFTASMAQELTGSGDAVPLLSRLHRDYLLVERHGEAGFRLHDLLRMFLLQRGAFEQDEPARAALSVRAALLLADNDQFPAAVELLVATRSWRALAELIEQKASLLVAQGRLATLGSALDRVPAELCEGRAWLVYWRAVSLLGHAGGRAQLLAERAFHAFRATSDVAGTLLSWALAVRATVSHGDALYSLGHWLALLEEMALVSPTPAIAAKLELSKLIAHAFHDTPQAVAVADAALEIVCRHGTPDEVVLAQGFATRLYLLAGDGKRVDAVQSLARGQLSGRAPDPMARIIYLHGEAVRELARARPKTASRAAEQALLLAEESGLHAWNAFLLGTAGLSAVGRRDFAAAERMAEALTAGPGGQSNFARGYQGCVRTWLAFEQGDLEKARRELRELWDIHERVGFQVGCYAAAIAQVIYEGAGGDATAIDQAMVALDSCLGPRPSAFHAAAADLARVYARLCRGERVEHALRDALRRARQSGYGIFLGSRVIARLVSAAFEYGIELEQALELREAYDLQLEHAPAALPGLRAQRPAWVAS